MSAERVYRARHTDSSVAERTGRKLGAVTAGALRSSPLQRSDCCPMTRQRPSRQQRLGLPQHRLHRSILEIGRIPV